VGVRVSALEATRELAARHPRLKAGTRYVHISVSDDGAGIDESIRHRVFDPFFTTRPGKGTGLGLATVYGIVTGLQGDVSVESVDGAGTRFDVYLPESEGAAVQKAPATPDGALLGRDEHVLFVDDEEATLRTVATLLEFRGFRVTAVADPLEALERFRAEPGAYDVVLTDQTMPRMTGIQLALELMSARPDVPVILTTGFSEAASRDYALALGLREFIRKPFMGREVSELIRRVLDEDEERRGEEPARA
jgi:CheY-like chemotaxis protein